MKYLVNKKTKEHYIQPGMMVPYGPKYDEVRADSEGWIKHTGTECPLPDDCRVEVKVANGLSSYARARRYVWNKQDDSNVHISHYRPILEQAEPVEEPCYDPLSVSFNLIDRLKAAHEAAQTIPDLEAELREVLGSMGYDLVARSPFTPDCCNNPEQCWEPCGELGKSESHVAVAAEPEQQRQGAQVVVMARFTVKIRPVYDGRAMRPNAKQINGKTYNFMLGWVMDKGDRYPCETAWIPIDETYPKDAPTWLASGDLERQGVEGE